MPTRNGQEVSNEAMYTRHDELPVLATRPHEIAAKHYNIVFRALGRLSKTVMSQGIRLELPGLRTLDLILQNDAWIIVDRAFNDIPVAAWTDLQAPFERALHQPVVCQLRYFHLHADAILEHVLTLMDVLLEEQLSDGDESHTILAFPKPAGGENES